jgi:hypothetical protein
LGVKISYLFCVGWVEFLEYEGLTAFLARRASGRSAFGLHSSLRQRGAPLRGRIVYGAAEAMPLSKTVRASLE